MTGSALTYSRKVSSKDYWVCPKCSRRHDPIFEMLFGKNGQQLLKCDGCGYLGDALEIYTEKRKKEISKLKKDDQIIQMLFDLQESVSTLRGDVSTMHRLVEEIANR